MKKLEPKLIFQTNITTPNAKILSELANDPPSWRSFSQSPKTEEEPQPRTMSSQNELRGKNYLVDGLQSHIITAALALRRPVLVSGHAGVGKTSLAYAIAWQLGLGNVLRWSINSRSALKEGLYEYDAVARLRDASLRKSKDDALPGWQNSEEENIGDYITLGPLGTALLPRNKPNGYYQPYVLLIDELDKGDIDLPNDLLHVLEEGCFDIPEVARSKSEASMKVKVWGDNTLVEVPANGHIHCDDFPLVIMTTNGEREFSPAFRRRCLDMKVAFPDALALAQIVTKRMQLKEPITITAPGGVYSSSDPDLNKWLIKLQSGNKNIKDTAVDQLLNAFHFLREGFELNEDTFNAISHSIT